MRFIKTNARNIAAARNLGILFPDRWDDFSYKTMFSLVVFDETSVKHELGNIKIGFVGQTTARDTVDVLMNDFTDLPDNFFSLGQDADYYKKLSELDEDLRVRLLTSLRDVVYSSEILRLAKEEHVFSKSLTRTISDSSIDGQFKRVLNGQAVLTDFDFEYKSVQLTGRAAYSLTFSVRPNSKPPTNIHVLIGRNGVGKTTLLNDMVMAVTDISALPGLRGGFYEEDIFGGQVRLDNAYFGGVVSVSFSAFDPFVPPPDQTDRKKGLTNFYIGLKVAEEGESGNATRLKNRTEINSEFVKSLFVCFNYQAKKRRWLEAISKLESDEHFADMQLRDLAKLDFSSLLGSALPIIEGASSGHATVLLTMTKLVETVEEKTLVLMDEPESHLHPPLLSAFVRALSDLLISQNGIAIIATHSPVVVQEVPSSCVWKLYRTGGIGSAFRPESETFGENVSSLTRDIFQLEVAKSGFHSMLSTAVQTGKDFDEIAEEYGGRLGNEARAILRALISAKR